MDNESLEELQSRVVKLEIKLEKLGNVVEILVDRVKYLEGHEHHDPTRDLMA